MNSGPTLQSGSTGPDVRRLQRLLVELKILSFDHIDGNFGAPTEAAVKDFQSGDGLSVDGIVGPQEQLAGKVGERFTAQLAETGPVRCAHAAAQLALAEHNPGQGVA